MSEKPTSAEINAVFARYDSYIEKLERKLAGCPQEFFWLIESPNHGHPVYFTGHLRGDNGGWVSHADKAARFPTKDAAATVITQMRLWDIDIGAFRDIEPKEHGFIYVRPGDDEPRVPESASPAVTDTAK